MCKTRWSLYLAVLLISGCTMAPHYEQPAAPVAGEWPDKGSGGATVGPVKEDKTAAADIGWKDFFKDAKLQHLIELSLKNNRNLRVASLNVQKARAQYRIQRAELFPKLDMTADGSAKRIPKDLSGTGFTTTAHQYDVGLGFTSYELDLFGRIQSLKNQTLEQYLSLAETRISTQITLVSEVANAYLTLLTDQGLLKITQDTLRSQQESYDIEKQRAAQGIGTDLDVRQAETSVREAESNMARYTRQVAQDLNALTLLVGEPLSNELISEISKMSDGPDDRGVLTELAPGLPSDLLVRRPDIRAAEHDLKAANANIGAARAAFFPSIILTGGIGTSSQSLSGLFAGGQNVWNFAPVIRLPIFDGGVNAGSLDAAKISKNIEIARYEFSIQTAFREVSDALVARSTLNDQLKADQLLVAAAAESYRLYEMRYNAGVDTYINVLIWHRQLYSAQQALLNTRLSRLSNLVTLYKALGGGWTDQTPPVSLKTGARLRQPEENQTKLTAN
ncbi:MAG: multidrug transporter [Verrucomicrobia bacterium Tous-C9LFEB]|nr:MAG: multidrug transporter [Verrucomicrobia bacterium Tous-C9LFEB]